MVTLAIVVRAALLLGAAPEEPPQPTPAIELSWSAPAGCPAADDVRAAIVELIGRPLAEDPSRVLRVSGAIEGSGDTWTLALSIDGEGQDGERTFEAARCDELLGPAAVVVAIAVDPAVGDETRVPDAPAKSSSPPTTARPRVEPPPPKIERSPAPPRRRRPVRAVLGLRGGVDGGNLPVPGGMIEASAGATIGRARLELVGLHVFARTVDGASGGGAFRTTAARAQGCFAPERGRLSVPLCAGVELGVLHGQGVDVMRSAEARKLWLAFVVGAGVAWAVRPRLALVLRGDLVVSPLRHEFTLQEDDLVTTNAVGGRGLLGLEVRLP